MGYYKMREGYSIGSKADKTGCPFCGSRFVRVSLRTLYHYECGSRVHIIGVDQGRTYRCFKQAGEDTSFYWPKGDPELLVKTEGIKA